MIIFGVTSFQKILRDIEPFVTSQFERYPWWSDFKKVVATGYMGAHWVQNGVKDLHGTNNYEIVPSSCIKYYVLKRFADDTW